MGVPPPFANRRISIVMITRDRCKGALRTVHRLLDLPDRPRIIVVDNGSSDGTISVMRELAPRIEAIEAGANLGAAGRNIGVIRSTTPYVAFSDDDSWCAPGGLDAAADRLDRDPRLGLLAAKILVGPEQRLDPMCRLMAHALRRAGNDDMVPIVGFVACGAVVRRSAFLDAGGFERRYGVGGEERLLALDLLREKWKLRYVPSIVAHHHPSPARNRAARRRRETRNDLWSAWLRRPLPAAIAATRHAMRTAIHDRAVRLGFTDALREARWVLANRMPIPREIERDVRRAERGA
jgi:GT2 family glycosyltransferase